MFYIVKGQGRTVGSTVTDEKKMKEAADHIQEYGQLRASKKEVKQANKRAEEADAKVKKMEDLLERHFLMPKTTPYNN